MKRLLITTMLVSAMATVPAIAQTADPAQNTLTDPLGFAAPEGFVLQETPLTAEILLGASVYSLDGDSIGDVHDLVINIEQTRVETMPGEAADTDPVADGTTGMTGTTDTDMAGDADAGGDTAVIIDPDAPEAGSDTDTTAATDTGASTGAGTETDTSVATETEADTQTDTDLAAGSGEGTNLTAGVDSATGTAATEGETTGMAADSSTDMATSATPEAGADMADEEEGAITHAILDIGGFLGLGEHRVAVPVSDLQVYTNQSETRIYLPWTQEQLEAMPEYDENDPTTLGDSLMSNEI